jgi:hypothetical protein
LNGAPLPRITALQVPWNPEEDIMLQKNANVYETRRADKSLQVVLWTIWTVAVIGTGVWNWRLDAAAGRPINFLGIAIYSILAGLVGMLVVTMVELWLEPDRFVD